ncbi:MAG: hypothetical protein ACTSUE_24010 [Promethearchaeota archaeon]
MLVFNLKINVRSVKVNEGKSNLKASRPKAGILNTEDFKCIFCFNLPKFPQDKGRGIILCPTCRHPAHADEFKAWLANSPYVPVAMLRKNPKIIPFETSIKVIKEFSKEK